MDDKQFVRNLMEHSISILCSYNFLCKEVCLTGNTIIKMLALYLKLVYFLQHLYSCKQVGCGRAYSTEHELRLHEVICCNGKSMCCKLYARHAAVSWINIQ
jgi:hypothetical protein